MESGSAGVFPTQKGTPMYEMRAEPTMDKRELVWHVIAKDATAGTLCGSHLPTPPHPATDGEATAERYCVPCMTAFSSAVRERRPQTG